MTTAALASVGEITCVAGESFAVSGVGGGIERGFDHGVFVRDTRFLDRLEVRADGQPMISLSGHALSASSAVFHGYLPTSGGSADPVLLVERRRVVADSLHEEIEISNRGRETYTFTLEIVCGTDYAYIFDVKHRRRLDPASPVASPHGVRFERPGGDERTEVIATPAPDEVRADTLAFDVTLSPRQIVRICLDVLVTDVYGKEKPRRRCEAFTEPVPAERTLSPSWSMSCSDSGLQALVRRGFEDLGGLKSPDPLAPDDRFCAAGSPWYLTLFGRDSLWTAFMALPFDPALAIGTLRTLARRQGTRLVEETEEAPGKILHEIRRGSLAHRGDLPPAYYGTIDATPLFVVLANEAWRWGLSEEDVVGLLPNVEAALAWMRDYGDRDGDGFLEYLKPADRGLENQGWKDSPDGIQFADGRIAQPPITLAEVQGYAYDAALRGAELLEWFGRPGAEDWRRWAERLRERFDDAFWVSDDLGRYPAIALDRDNTPVDAPASNMGHLLASGIVDDDQSASIATRLAHPSMASGWGLRTMATTTAGYNPLSYHGGSVWPHDTAIAIWGLARRHQVATARRLLTDLTHAGAAFRYRLPELFSGHSRRQGGVPVPYPVACRPQAWSAAAGLLLLRSCIGVDVHVPQRRVTLAPIWPPPVRHLELRGIPIGPGYLDVRLDAASGVWAEPRGVDVEVEVRAPRNPSVTNPGRPT